MSKPSSELVNVAFRVVDRTSIALGYASGFALFAITLIITADVILRYVFNAPTVWASEIATYLMIGAVFLGAAYTYLKGGHLKVDTLTESLPAGVRGELDVVTTWLGFVFVAALAWQCYVAAFSSYVGGAREFTLLMTPRYIPQLPIAIGAHLLSLQILIGIVRRRGSEFAAGCLLAVVAVIVAASVALALIGMHRYGRHLAGFGLSTIVFAFTIVVLMTLISGARVAATVVITLLIAATAFHYAAPLSAGQFVTFFMVAVLVVLVAGVPISFGLGLVGLLAVYFCISVPQPIMLGDRAWSATNTVTLTAVPAFVLMGEFLVRSGVSDDLFAVLVRWIGRWPGGLSHAGIASCALFAAVSGSSVATAATIGAVAGPEMLKRGYSPKVAYGSLAAGGTLGILIPPSIPLLVYASTAGVSIAACFAAAIIPGIVMTAFFMLTLAVWSLLDPGVAPQGPASTWRDRLSAVPKVFPVLLLVVLVLGTIYVGIATPTEAASVGCIGAIAICLFRGRLTWQTFWEALASAIRVNSFIFLILVGASASIYILDYLEIPSALTRMIVGLHVNRWVIMTAIYLFFIVLGSFMDVLSMMVMTIPVMFPVIVALGFDPFWFSVVLVILMEKGLIMPPVGMNLFVLQSISGQPMRDIAIGALPFVLAMLVVIAILSFFPGLATWLPSLMLK